MREIARVGCVAAAGLAALLGGGAAAAESAAPEFEYVRDAGTYGAIAKSIRERAAGDPVLFVFDAASFEPPPGRTEFVADHDLGSGGDGELMVWIEAIHDAWGGAAAKPWVATTVSKDARPLDLAAWNEIHGLLRTEPWWQDDALLRFTPADRVLGRLTRQVPGERRVVVLVTGDVLPERSLRRPPLDGSTSGADEQTWRRKLLDPGEYWDEERVGADLALAKARLFVVAPPARFGDFLPLEEVPQMPWASRPRALGPPGFEVPEPRLDTGPVERELRAKGLTDEQVREALAQLGARASDLDFATPGSRFAGALPAEFATWGGQKPFNTDVPSAYGKWQFARAAARTGGAYWFYPRTKRGHGDAQPLDPLLAEALAPELVPAAQFAVRRKGDAALTALLAAQQIVFDSTPWTDDAEGPSSRHARSWCGFGTGNAPSDAWRPREKPWGDVLSDPRSPAEWKALGPRIARALADYDGAISELASAQEKLAAGALEGTCRRSEANLRLCRFWFETSAFHLEALSIYLAELGRWIPKDAAPATVSIRPALAFRLSDCLAGYGSRTIDPAAEKELGHFTPPDRARGSQSNLLYVPDTKPDYRAQRDVNLVLLHLDPRLLRRATRVIDAARDVMTHEGRSAWGWVVYYTDAFTFVWEPVPKGAGR